MSVDTVVANNLQVTTAGVERDVRPISGICSRKAFGSGLGSGVGGNYGE